MFSFCPYMSTDGFLSSRGQKYLIAKSLKYDPLVVANILN